MVSPDVRDRQHQQTRRQLILDPTRVRRNVGAVELSVPWSQVRSLAVVRNELSGQQMLVIETDPPRALVPSERRARSRARLDERLYGGDVVVPVSASGLAEEELRGRIEASTKGGHELVRRPFRT